MRRTEPERVDTIFEGMLREGRTDAAFRAQRASYLWPDIVGPEVNRHTYRRYVERGELHVFISSGPLKAELEFQKASLLRHLNDAAGGQALTAIVIH